MRKIGGFLGRSPRGPLQEHMLKVQDCVDQLVPIAEAFVRGNADRVRELCDAIVRLEAEADDIKNAIRHQLSGSLFSAVERQEVTRLLKAQDDIADETQDLAIMLDVRRTTVPTAVAAEFLDLAREVAGCVRTLTDAMNLLAGMPRDATDADATDAIIEATNRVSEKEYQLEERAHCLLRRLFAAEDQTDTISVVLLMQAIRDLARIARKTENSAGAVTRMAFKD